MKVGFSKISLSIASTTKYLLENINSATIKTATTIKDVHSKADGPSVVARNLTTTGMGVLGGKQLLKSIACGDKPCTIVSCAGLCFDGVNLVTSYIPNCKAIQGVASSMSISCKLFVYLCDGGSSPWNKFC